MRNFTCASPLIQYVLKFNIQSIIINSGKTKGLFSTFHRFQIKCVVLTKKAIFWSNNSIFYSFWISCKYFIRRNIWRIQYLCFRNNWRRCFFFKDLQKYQRPCQRMWMLISQQRREGGNWICCWRSSKRNNICLGVTTIDTITTLLTIKMSKTTSNPSTKILL